MFGSVALGSGWHDHATASAYYCATHLDATACEGEVAPTEHPRHQKQQQYAIGVIRPEDVNPDWSNMQQARWSAETGLKRMQTVLGAAFETNVDTPRAYLYAGFANRLLGENVCVALTASLPRPL